MGRKTVALAGLVLFLPLYSAVAASFTGITAFGDSLTDNGNAFLLSGGTYPGPNYALYSFAANPSLTTSFYSDGPNTSPVATGPQGLWIDQLAGRLGVADPQPIAAGGTNFAIASAQTGNANAIDMGFQLATFLGLHPTGAPSSSLYTFWGGANDILNRNSPITAADNIEGDIQTLAGVGAKTFLWLNLPPLGDTPEGMPYKAILNAASAAFDGEWAKDVAALQGKGIDVIGVDIGTLFADVVANPGNYGFTNVTQSAQTSGAKTDAGYLFWDDVHPTTTGHELVSDAAYNALTPTPEPASASLAVLGLLALAGSGVKARLSRPN